MLSAQSRKLFFHLPLNDLLKRRRRTPLAIITITMMMTSPPLLLLLRATTLLLLSATSTHGFFAPPITTQQHHVGVKTHTQQLHLSKRINNKIDLDSPKVATMEKFANDDNKKIVYCRCWKSETFPLCDGSHMKHNKECGDNVGPLIVTVDTSKKEEEEVNEEEDKTINDAAATTTATSDAVVASEKKSTSLLDKLKSMFQKDQTNNSDDGGRLTTKERLAKMGLSALLSYGWVSNMSYAITLSLSWYTHSKKTGLSPLAPGQWKPFLAVYAGFYVFNNIIRPLRFGMSVVVSRYFDQFVDVIQRKSGWGRKASIGVVVFLANVCGTFAAMGLGVSVASGLAGVPIFPPK
jgi:CDGSH-type Zn-finger protein